MDKPSIHVTHFSDVLCIWAYVSQVRIDELRSQFGAQVDVDCRLFPVFGSALRKTDVQWANKGGRQGYSEHVRQIAQQFNHVTVHPQIWIRNAPYSSLPAHLFLYAIRVAEAKGALPARSFERMAWKVREAFFAQSQNVSERAVLQALASDGGLDISEIERGLQSGEAHALMSEDMQAAHDQAVRSSPTLIFNEDRQRITGNVGYRIIEANIRELLERPQGQQSWC